MSGIRPSAIRELLQLGADPEIISFGGGYPDTQNSTLNMAAASEYLSSFDIDAHIERALPVYRHKRDLMLATMAETFPDTVRYTTPDRGLFVWLTFPEELDATAFMAEKLLPEAKVAFVPGATFLPSSRHRILRA